MEEHFELNCKDELFNKLEDLNNDPNDNWWKKILKDDKLYVNIRKGNKVSVYYKGAEVIGELHLNENNEMVGKITGKYRKGWCKNNKPSPKEIVENLENVKKNIDNNRKTNKKGEPKKSGPKTGMTEDEIKGELYTKGEYNDINDGIKYIDTEFAFKDNNLDIRIDLITITTAGMIEFVELKGISDGRLNKKDMNPPIIEQMKNYRQFIKDCENEIPKYYKKVQKIMRTIGVENSLAKESITIIGVCKEPRLLIAGYKKREIPYRKCDLKRIEKRLEKIETILKDNNIKSNIKTVLENFERGTIQIKY